MLEYLLGNKTEEKVLFFISRYNEGYARNIALTFGVSLDPVQKQLRRLEAGGVIVSRFYGKVRLYRFNPRYPFLAELKALIEKAFKFLPQNEVDKYYMRRTRPRKQGKAI